MQPARFEPAVNAALLEYWDLASGRWRVLEFENADFMRIVPSQDSCPAIFPSLDNPRGPLDVVATAAPITRGARFFFNGAMGVDGSQLWTEVWFFEDESAASAAVADLRESFNSPTGSACAERSGSANLQTDEFVLARPAYSVPDSASYTLRHAYTVSGRPYETNMETHVVGHGRVVGLMIFFDHAPADLWDREAERLVTLFDARVRAVAEGRTAPAPIPTSPELRQWAVDFCAALNQFADATSQLNSADQTLSREEQRTQAQQLIPETIEAYERAEGRLRAVQAPEIAAGYHSDMIEVMEASRVTLQELLEVFTEPDIEEALREREAAFVGEMQRTAALTESAEAALPPDVRRAMYEPGACTY